MAYNINIINSIKGQITDKINVIDPDRNEAIKDLIKLSDCFPIPDDPIGDFGKFFIDTMNYGIENNLITPIDLGCETQEEFTESFNEMINDAKTESLNLPDLSILTDWKKITTTVFYPYDEVLEQLKDGELTDNKLNNIINNHIPHLLDNNVKDNNEYLPISELTLATIAELINNTIELNPNTENSFENIIEQMNEVFSDKESNNNTTNYSQQKSIILITIGLGIAAGILITGAAIYSKWKKGKRRNIQSINGTNGSNNGTNFNFNNPNLSYTTSLNILKGFSLSTPTFMLPSALFNFVATGKILIQITLTF